MKIAIGADHAGFELKSVLINQLSAWGHIVKDVGTYTNASCDYPDYAHAVAQSVESGEVEMGVLICGSANGVAITANKHAAIRAAICWKVELATVARSHNDANVVCLPARFITAQEATDILLEFLKTPFEGGRHARRVSKISQ